MTKADQFLWIVQTVLIRNAINLACDEEDRIQYRHEISATGAFGTCDDALRASELIPSNMSASDAAHEFLGFMLDNWREAEDDAQKKKSEVPSWFAQGAKKPSVYEKRGILKL